MAESKFLKHQDKNADLLIDACEGKELEPPPPFVCPKCTPNPFAIVPDWKNQTKDDPFFNEKICKYQITIVTNLNSTNVPEDTDDEGAADAAVQEIYSSYIDEAAEYLLSGNGLATTEANIELISSSLESTEYYLNYRPGSKLKLLFSIDKETFDSAELDEEEEEEEEEEDEESGSSTTTTYEIGDLISNLIKVRKGLKLYNRYLKVYRAMDDGNLVFADGGRIFNLKDYGDFGGPIGNSTLADILGDLDKFLNLHDMNIRGLGSIGFLNDAVEKVEFTFSKKFKLTKLKVWTEGCGEKPTTFKKKKLLYLRNRPSFSDPTAMSYLAKLEQMVTDLSAREPKPWIEFLMEHTYPEIEETFGYPTNQPDPGSSTGSCVGGALQREAKQLGQDILDEVFSIGDAIAFQFHKSMCIKSRQDLRNMDIKMGLVYDADKNTSKFIEQMAQEQAFRKINVTNDPFENLCFAFSQGATNLRGTSLSQFWSNSFVNIKLCGLTEFLMSAMNCLMSGMSLEQALSKIILSALQGMSIENLGNLFVGLPESQQARLDSLVKKKLESGDLFAEGTSGQQVSDAVAGDLEVPNQQLSKESTRSVKWYRPWENEDVVREDRAQRTQEATEATGESSPSSPNRTLAQSRDFKGNPNQLSPNIIVQAYILALIEVYSDDLLSLVDMLNKFPGAQLLAKAIAMLRCPGPPLIDPSIMDFIKSIELPFCRSIEDITLPRLNNPAWWIPDLKDFGRLVFKAAMLALQQIILNIIMKLFVKLCEILGSLVCKLLGAAGSLAASIPDMITGQDTFRDAIRNAICGEEAPDDQIDKTIQEILKTLGIGGQALSDPEQVNNFTSDLSSAVTPKEMMNAFLGNPSDEFLKVVESLIKSNYPDWADAMSNQRDIASFFDNCGNLFPASFNDRMNDFVAQAPDDLMPANPSLCADPAAIEDFCELRASLLVSSGRTTAAQAAAMCQSDADQALTDLKDLADVLQDPSQYIANNLPPMVSDPGCNDGLLPYESDQMIASSVGALKGELRKLKAAFATDMIGNGPGESNWGLINMMLSDTMGNPLTAHYRKEALQPNYIDFYHETDTEGGDGPLAIEALQRGAFPNKIAKWLQTQLFMEEFGYATDLYYSMGPGGTGFVSNNKVTGSSVTRSSFENYGFQKNMFGVYNLNTYDMPIRSYSTRFTVDVLNEQIIATQGPRKGDPDIRMTFNNNADGNDDALSTYGFHVEGFFSELTAKGINAPGDNIRVRIVDIINPLEAVIPDAVGTAVWSTIESLAFGSVEDLRYEETRYEFLSTDSTLSGLIDLLDDQKHIKFLSMFGGPVERGIHSAERPGLFINTVGEEYIPQVVLLAEILDTTEYGIIKTFYDSTMTGLFQTISAEIAQQEDNPAFDYGAKYDDLTSEDVQYLIPEGLDNYGELYSEATITDYAESGDTERKIKNSDGILGISRDQYNNMNNDPPTPENIRVFYLDPAKFGGTYKNPPIYIKPPINKGWLGLVDVLFPDISPCKPHTVDIANFQELEEIIEKVYPTISEDQRLKAAKPDCIVELPFNRVLERYSTAAIEGLIYAACRIYATTHIIKALPVFMKFKPSFDNVVSSVYASYIVEEMESSFKDAQGDFLESFNPFKDNEFWYAFLEQAVQMYARKVDSGEIEDPPVHVVNALMALNDFQEEYKNVYPQKEFDPEDPTSTSSELNGNYMKADKDLKFISRLTTLKKYRHDKNLEAVFSVSDTAKIVLKELVTEELNKSGEKIVEALKMVGLGPDQTADPSVTYTSDLKYWTDISNYILNKLTYGSDLDLEEPLKQEYTTLPTEENPDPNEEGLVYPGPYYTNGQELVTEDSEDYIGYYHVHTDEDGNVTYMKGEYHLEEDHDALRPLSTKVSVLIGTVDDYGDSSTDSGEKIFLLQKYTSINGTKYSPTAAADIIYAASSGYDAVDMPNISDIYPGTLEQVLDPFGTGSVIGLDGELGVRHGLQFSIVVNGTAKKVTTVEVDALDLKLDSFQTLENNSKLLLCLIDNLKNDTYFKLITKYIFPLNKVIGLHAIYVDMGMLESIGQFSASITDTLGATSSTSSKPGMYAENIEFVENEDGSIIGATADLGGNDGWAHPLVRKALSAGYGGAFVREYDNWDKVLLRNSKSTLKRQFKQFYYERDYGDAEKNKLEWPRRRDDNPADTIIKRLRDALKPNLGHKLLPRRQRKMIRSNPFDSKGKLCDK